MRNLCVVICSYAFHAAVKKLHILFPKAGTGRFERTEQELLLEHGAVWSGCIVLERSRVLGEFIVPVVMSE